MDANDYRTLINEDNALTVGAEVTVYDPEGNENARRRFPRLGYVDSVAAAVRDADLVLLLTEWNEFKQLDLARLRSEVRRPIFVDGRNLYDLETMAAAGFTYLSIGRGTNGHGSATTAGEVAEVSAASV